MLVGFRERNSSLVADIDGCEVLVPQVGRLIGALSALVQRLSIRSRVPQVEVAAARPAMATAAATFWGHPSRRLELFGVTGTNGKTTTSRMIETLLRERGLSTGLMTSPHLHDERERIRLNGEPVDIEQAAFQPTVFLYDSYPGGIGLSAPLYDMRAKVTRGALSLV